MTYNPHVQQRAVRPSEKPWLALTVLAMVLGTIALGAFVFGLGGGMSQTASTSPIVTPELTRTQ